MTLWTALLACGLLYLCVIRKERSDMERPVLDPEASFRTLPEQLQASLRQRAAWIASPLLNQPLRDNYPAPTILLYGLAGTDSGLAAAAFAREFMNRGYLLLQTDGRALEPLRLGEDETYIRAFFDAAVDQAPCVLLIGDLEMFCPDRAAPGQGVCLWRRTVAFLQVWNDLVWSGGDVIVLGFTNAEPERVDAALLDKIELLCIPAAEK